MKNYGVKYLFEGAETMKKAAEAYEDVCAALDKHNVAEKDRTGVLMMISTAINSTSGFGTLPDHEDKGRLN